MSTSTTASSAFIEGSNLKDGQVLVRGFSNIATTLETNSAVVPASGKECAWTWFCQPDAWETVQGRREGRDGSWQVEAPPSSPSSSSSSTATATDANTVLTIRPPAKKDFWRKTYYEPAFCKDDGPVLYTELEYPINTASSGTVQPQYHYTIQTSFSLQAASQFDQAGLFVRLDAEHWIKSGIEVVDGIPRLSAVVCNVYSDWSTQPWTTLKTTTTPDTSTTRLDLVHTQAKLRIHCRGTSFVVEAAPLKIDTTENDAWQLVRIAHLSRSMTSDPDPLEDLSSASCGPAAPLGKVWVGPFACAPADQKGCKAVFWDCTVTAGSNFAHHAEENQE